MSEDITPESAGELASRMRDVEQALRRASTEPVPADEPILAGASGLKGWVKRRQFRISRPVSQRSDRIAADLAAQDALVADETARLAERLALAETRISALEREIGRLGAAGAGPSWEATPREVGDSYYWAFESEMRGSVESIVHRLRQYEARVVGVLDEIGREPAPRWLDLGCGNGEFLSLLSEWGWRAAGVDSSPKAVEACHVKGMEAAEGDALAFLHAAGDAAEADKPTGISAIQLIEHLPKDRWLWLFRAARRAVRPGGVVLVETINPLNPEALAGSFFADVSHTWPAHPHSLRIMAEQAGFASADIVFLNDDHHGNAMDFAIWARTPMA